MDRCIDCNDELAISERFYCNQCRGRMTPAQEEKEMEHCTKHQMRYGQGETCLSCAADLRERWDRAYFAALAGVSGTETTQSGPCWSGDAVEYAANVANETIRRHADMMAARDAIIAEVVG